MRSISTTSIITAPRSAVWAVLADFPNVADWNNGVKKSFSTSEASSGVGAQRHCDIAPAGSSQRPSANEEPDTMMAISIDSAKRCRSPRRSERSPSKTTAIRRACSSISSIARDSDVASWTGRQAGLDKQFAKSFDGYMTDLQAAVQATTPSHC